MTPQPDLATSIDHSAISHQNRAYLVNAMSTIQGERIQANCKKIWGAEKDFELDIETDDYEYYSCLVREDRGDSFGPPLTMTSLCYGEDRAWDELDRMLSLWARQADGEEMTRKETLDIFSGPKGEHKYYLNAFLDKKAKRDASAAAKKVGENASVPIKKA
jgi:hypothetical protein